MIEPPLLLLGIVFISSVAAAQHAHNPGDASPASHDMSSHSMTGAYGNYPMTREASGTSWQPENTPMEGWHHQMGDWSLMLHGFAYLVYDNQGGPRGKDAIFSPNMVMAMAQRPAGAGTLSLRAMLSLEPATIRENGYPLLLQTGETGDGRTPLLDRQHPHDLFMELSAAYRVDVGADSSLYAYFGLPGEPALGPPAFMHRWSGMDNPEAPITHHWLDSTHITYGVGTLGYVWKDLKFEGSIFTGREPDEYRWDLETPTFDSYSLRLSYNPTTSWSFQTSWGHLNSPEQLHPEIDTERLTASASYHRKWEGADWQTTAAWGQNRHRPGKNLDGLLLESAIRFRQEHTLFGRAEYVEKDELFLAGNPKAEEKFNVAKLSLGYIYDFPEWNHVWAGLGAVGSAHFLPGALREAYGDTPLSFMLFARLKL